jgi:nicotinamidase-related amidase
MGLNGQEKKLFTFEHEKTALIIVDMQNEFVRQGGLIYVEDAIKTVPDIQKLIKAFRRKKMPIVYTKAMGLASSIAVPTLKRRYYEILHPDWIEEKACVKGHKRYFPDVGKKLDCSDIIEEIYPEPSDIIIEKAFYNAFQDTILEYILRGLKVEYLVVVGTATHVCVESTAKGAFDRQFMVAIVSDGVSSYLPDLHAGVLKSFKMMWGRVMTADEVIGELK